MLKIEDPSLLLTLNFKGKNGFEKNINCLFPKLKRLSERNFDFVDPDDGLVYEAKKQQNDQWFDISKFYNLTKAQGRMQFLFILIYSNSGLVESIFSIEKTDFLHILINDKKYKKYGWTFSAIEEADNRLKESPQLQYKAKVSMRKFFKEHRDKITIIYEKI